MKKNGNSRTSLLLEQEMITTCRHRPLIDPMVLIILILPMLVLLFLFFLSHVPKIIKPASFQSTLSCFNIFLVLLVLLVILFRSFNPMVDGPSTNKVVENDQNLDVEGANDESQFYDSVDWLMSDEEIDASGNSDDQRTPIPPMPWIHANSNKLDLHVSDATAKITSSEYHRIKRKRRKYRPKVKNIRRATAIPPAPPPPRAPSLAEAPTPVQGQKSIFQIMFKKPRKATQIPFVITTTVPLQLPPLPSRSLFPNFFTSRNKIKNIRSSKNSKLPPLPPTRPPPQPEPQLYDQQSSICSSSESSYLPPPLSPFNVRLGSYNSNTSGSPDLQLMGQPSTFIKDWMIMTDEAMDTSGNSDDQRTPTPPPVHWIHVNYNKPEPQVSDDTNEKSSSDDQSYDTKRKRKTYRLRLRNKRRVTPSIRAVRRAPAPAPATPAAPARAPATPAAPAQAPAPAPAPPASIFGSMFKKQNKDKRTHPNTAAPTPPPRSFLNNIFKPGNKNKKLPSSKTSPLPPTRSRPHPQPKTQPQPQHYYRPSSTNSSSQSSYIPQSPPPPPFDMPADRYKYIGEYHARLRSFNSNTSSSPDLQPMGQSSTSTDGGDQLWSSPDVNAKADIFISKGKDIWKIEQEYRVEKKGGPSLVNKPNINKYN